MSLLMLGLVGVAAVATSYVVDAVTTWTGSPASTWPTWAAVIGGGLAAVFAPGLLSVIGIGAALGAGVRAVSTGAIQLPGGWGLDPRFKAPPGISPPAAPPAPAYGR